MSTWENIKRANESIKTTDIKGKEYAEVNQRIKAFRMVYPDGDIRTEMLSNENGICVFRATVFDGEGKELGCGTAYEKENGSYINKTSYIENCETSAVGRALGMCGFGIDTSVASYEEVANAMKNQAPKNPKQDKEKMTALKTCIEKTAKTIGESPDKLLNMLKAKFGMEGQLHTDAIDSCINYLVQLQTANANRVNANDQTTDTANC